MTQTGGSAPKPRARSYSCQITQPANDDPFPNATSVNATVTTSPSPQDGDQVVLTLDGARVSNFPVTGGSITIAPIERGTHSLQAVVQDATGNTVCQSQSVSFTVLQPSILNPANPNFHH